MNLGFILGKVINPIILGIMYYILLTPFALILKLFGRDELDLKKKNLRSYWGIYSPFREGTGRN